MRRHPADITRLQQTTDIADEWPLSRAMRTTAKRRNAAVHLPRPSVRRSLVSMTLIRDDSGKTYSLMECPHCEVYESHASVPGRDGVFQCARCFAMFGDSN